MKNLYITENDRKGEVVDVDCCSRLGALATTLRHLVIERSVYHALGLCYTAYFHQATVDAIRHELRSGKIIGPLEYRQKVDGCASAYTELLITRGSQRFLAPLKEKASPEESKTLKEPKNVP